MGEAIVVDSVTGIVLVVTGRQSQAGQSDQNNCQHEELNQQSKRIHQTSPRIENIITANKKKRPSIHINVINGEIFKTTCPNRFEKKLAETK